MAGRKLPPATTPEQRESQLISMAMDLVEKRIREGTASAQETTHFLKLGTQREQLERQKLSQEMAMIDAKIEQMKNGEKSEQIALEALAAMRSYQGLSSEEEYLD